MFVSLILSRMTRKCKWETLKISKKKDISKKRRTETEFCLRKIRAAEYLYFVLKRS